MTLQEKLATKVVQLPKEDVPEASANQLSSALEIQSNLIPLRIQPEIKPLDVVPGFAISLAEAKDRVARLKEFVRTMMQPNVDYGLIPGCPKPTLLKPGAEKLCDIFEFAKLVEITGILEDWEKPFLAYTVKVILLNKRTGLVEAEGIGSCNSREKKYVKQDPYNVANTLLKMAKKRALIDAVLLATRSSGLFTQDMDDFDILPAPDNKPSIKKEAITTTAVASSTSGNFVSGVLIKRNLSTAPTLVTEAQLKFLRSLIVRKQISGAKARSILHDRYGIKDGSELTKAEASELIGWLQDH